MHRAAVAAQVVRGEVEREVGKGELVEHDLALATGERAQARKQLGGLEGLGHVVVGPRVEALHLVGGCGACGEHEHGGRVMLAAQLVHDVEAGHPGSMTSSITASYSPLSAETRPERPS